MRRSAEQLAHQRNSRIDQLDADMAALRNWKSSSLSRSEKLRRSCVSLKLNVSDCMKRRPASG